MIQRMIFVCLLGLLLVTVSTGQGEKTKAPLGTWVKEAGAAKLEFKIEAKTLKFSIKDNDKSIVVDADYAISRDGTLFGRIAKADNGGGDGPQAGMLFGFTFKVDGNQMTVSDLTGTDNNEARQAVEGTYTKK